MSKIYAHRRSLMADRQVFTYGDVVRLKSNRWSPYLVGDLLTIVQSALQQQGMAHRPRDPDCKNWDSFVNSYSCTGMYGGIAWLDLDEIERVK